MPQFLDPKNDLVFKRIFGEHPGPPFHCRKDAYHTLSPVYTLAILNETFDHTTKEFLHYLQIVNPKNSAETIPGLEFVLVELSDKKFKHATTTHRKMMVLWLRFLKRSGRRHERTPGGDARESIDPSGGRTLHGGRLLRSGADRLRCLLG